MASVDDSVQSAFLRILPKCVCLIAIVIELLCMAIRVIVVTWPCIALTVALCVAVGVHFAESVISAYKPLLVSKERSIALELLFLALLLGVDLLV